jgi:hypothetical protein
MRAGHCSPVGRRSKVLTHSGEQNRCSTPLTVRVAAALDLATAIWQMGSTERSGRAGHEVMA